MVGYFPIGTHSIFGCSFTVISTPVSGSLAGSSIEFFEIVEHMLRMQSKIPRHVKLCREAMWVHSLLIMRRIQHASCKESFDVTCEVTESM
jgi:hypothetical protein